MMKTRLSRAFFVLLATMLSAVASRSVHADITLNAGSSVFNFDTDGNSDFTLQRPGFTDVLENARFFVWISTEGVGNIRELTGAVENGGQVDFAPEVNVPSIDPDTLTTSNSGLLNASLVFTNFYENAQGHAVLDYELRVSGSAIHSNPGPLRTRIRLFSLFDYEGNGTEESITTIDGDLLLKDTTLAAGEGSLLVSPASNSFAKVGVFDTNSGPFNETSFSSTPLSTSGSNLAAGHWQTFVVPQDDPFTGPQDFTFVMKGSISAIPEPGMLPILVLSSVLAIGYRRHRTNTFG